VVSTKESKASDQRTGKEKKGARGNSKGKRVTLEKSRWVRIRVVLGGEGPNGFFLGGPCSQQERKGEESHQGPVRRSQGIRGGRKRRGRGRWTLGNPMPVLKRRKQGIQALPNQKGGNKPSMIEEGR